MSSALLNVHEIHPGLWMGGYPEEAWLLPAFGISVVYLCASELQSLEFAGALEIVRAPLEDRPLQPEIWSAVLKTGREISDRLRLNRHLGILVSCNQGINRGPIVAGVALTFLANLTGREVLAHLCCCREGVLTNITFSAALTALGKPSDIT